MTASAWDVLAAVLPARLAAELPWAVHETADGVAAEELQDRILAAARGEDSS